MPYLNGAISEGHKQLLLCKMERTDLPGVIQFLD